MICFYYTFKPYEKGDENYLDLFAYDIFSVMSVDVQKVITQKALHNCVSNNSLIYRLYNGWHGGLVLVPFSNGINRIKSSNRYDCRTDPLIKTRHRLLFLKACLFTSAFTERTVPHKPLHSFQKNGPLPLSDK